MRNVISAVFRRCIRSGFWCFRGIVGSHTEVLPRSGKFRARAKPESESVLDELGGLFRAQPAGASYSRILFTNNDPASTATRFPVDTRCGKRSELSMRTQIGTRIQRVPTTVEEQPTTRFRCRAHSTREATASYLSRAFTEPS